MTRLAPLTGLLAALLLTPWALAIDEPVEPDAPDAALYRIDVLVFAKSDPADEAAETWLPPKALPVPERLQPLLPAPAAADATATPDVKVMPATTTAGDSAPAATGNAMPAPYTLLDDLPEDFAQTAERMRRSRYFRVLLTASWRQPLPKGGEPVAVVLRGGDTFGEHQELEGTLQIWRERYLHAQARLWLSHFVEQTGNDTLDDWPSLPFLPLAPPATPATEPATPASDGSADTADNAPPPADATAPEDTHWGDEDWFATWHPDRIVVMDQKRRLKSGETHYLDHPLFGLVLRIEPADTGDSKAGN